MRITIGWPSSLDCGVLPDASCRRSRCLRDRAQRAGQPRRPAIGGLPWRSIGPANMSGRVTDVAVPRARPRRSTARTATGGVWKTDNNGTTWTPIFDATARARSAPLPCRRLESRDRVGRHRRGQRQQLHLLGRRRLQVDDGGRTFVPHGTGDTHHIGRIVIHPTNPNIVYVAAARPLCGVRTASAGSIARWTAAERGRT